MRALRLEWVVVHGFIMHGFGARWTKGTAEHKAKALFPGGQAELRCMGALVEQCQREDEQDTGTRGTFGDRGGKSDD